MLRLDSLNPAVKAFTVILCVLALALFFDPWTPLFFLIWTLGTGALLGRIHWKRWLLFLPPVLLFAFGYFWTVLLFGDGLEKGLSLGLRVLAFASLSFIFVFTTDPVQFIYSLMRQGRLPPKLAYGILAGFRFMPTLLDEFALLQKAHRIRGVDRARGLRERAKRIGRYLIPLLASAIRKAERTAMAMESKGFTGDRNRTYYYDLKVSVQDWAFLALMLSGLAVSIAVSWRLGTLVLYRVQL
jgi:energy-coupling factor transport system permease protein